ncbi:MAG TPA: TolC family protein [Vicinamibacterales bacterium]|nr:TolC family protein [Vicinamibacterales bacterium]
MKRVTSFAIALVISLGATASAQQPVANDAARQDSVVKQAMRTYQQGLNDIKEPASSRAVQPGTSSGDFRELRLEEAVSLALEKNLDIQVAKLEPQSVDFVVAGFRNQFQPVLASTVGQRDLFQLPTRTINGGTRVNQATTTYNASISQEVSKFGGNYSVSWSNQRVASSDALATRNPLYTTGLVASYVQPVLRGFKIDNLRQQLEINLINREISEESARATVTQTLANVRNAYWDLVFAQSAVDVAVRATELADKLVEDNQARVEVGTLAPLDIVQAQAEAATRRQNLAVAEAAAQTAELALKRFLVSGTDDPMWRQTIRPVDLPSLAPPPTDVEGAVRRALAERTDIINARKGLDSNDVNIKYFKDLSMPALDVTASYGAQGLGGPELVRASGGLDASVSSIRPGSYSQALGLLRQMDYPNWNFNVVMSYPLFGSQATAQHARARLQRNQSMTRIRALEVQIAAEVANAALTVQSNLKRVEAATAARELAQKRLEAEQSKFDVGMTTNFFVVQAQRDLRDAANTELRALADYRKSLVNFERSQQSPAGGGGGNFAQQQ